MVIATKRERIEVAVCDKSTLVRDGLRRIFEDDDRFNLVVVAADAGRLLEVMGRLSFEVAVTGWDTPYLNAPGLLKAMRSRALSARVIVYTGNSDPQIARRAMALGAAGFCHKSEASDRLIDTVLAVAAGRMAFPYVDVRALHDDPLAKLTERERETLAALAQGLTNRQLAKELSVSLNTVKFHLKNLYEKMGVENRAQAIASFLSRRSQS